MSILLAGVAFAETEAPLEEIVVTGDFAGPGMWKVTRADDPAGHVLWIVGDPPPLPKTMTWRSTALERVLAESQEILGDSAGELKSDEKIGLLRGLTLLPGAMKARKNPDDGLLVDQVPAELYARWLTQKALYLKRNDSVEEWRPIFAGLKLRQAAEEKFNLGGSGAVWERLRSLIEKKKIKTVIPKLTYTFKRSEARDMIKQFAREKLADTECFDTQLRLVESLAHRDIENARARAWATGDLEMLSKLAAQPNPHLPCSLAIMNAQVTRDLIPADIREQLQTLWIDTAEVSLAANQTTLAIVPLNKLTPEDGYLARLRARGLTIEAPR